MARQETEKYYEPSGKVHTVKSEWNFGLFSIYVDGVFYTHADNRTEVREIVDELVKYKLWSSEKPSKINTPPVPASN